MKVEPGLSQEEGQGPGRTRTRAPESMESPLPPKKKSSPSSTTSSGLAKKRNDDDVYVCRRERLKVACTLDLPDDTDSEDVGTEEVVPKMKFPK